MLERTVAELRGEEVEDETSVSINLGVDVAIPEEYISDMGQRLRTYKRVSSARDEEALASIREETQDRYGRLPESVEQLFAYARLRRLAEELGVLSIDKTADGVALKFSEKARISPEKLAMFINVRPGRPSLHADWRFAHESERGRAGQCAGHCAWRVARKSVSSDQWPVVSQGRT